MVATLQLQPGARPRTDFLPYFEGLGAHPVEAGGMVWFESGPSFYQSFPFHVVLKSSDAVRGVFDQNRALAARFPVEPPALPNAETSGLWIRRVPYNLDDLSSNNRSKVRRGMKRTTIEQIDFGDVATAGLKLAVSTAERQGVRFSRRHSDRWHRMCMVARRHPMMEAWAGLVDGEIAVLAIAFCVEGCYQISTVRSDARFLSSYPNNALIHHLLGEGFSRAGVASVCYGLASLDRGTEGLNEFKRSSGFGYEPVVDHLVARLPVLAAGRAFLGARRLVPASHRAAQLETVARSMSWWRRTSS